MLPARRRDSSALSASRSRRIGSRRSRIRWRLASMASTCACQLCSSPSPHGRSMAIRLLIAGPPMAGRPHRRSHAITCSPVGVAFWRSARSSARRSLPPARCRQDAPRRRARPQGLRARRRVLSTTTAGLIAKRATRHTRTRHEKDGVRVYGVDGRLLRDSRSVVEQTARASLDRMFSTNWSPHASLRHSTNRTA